MQIFIIRAFSFDSLKKIVNFEPRYKSLGSVSSINDGTQRTKVSRLKQY